MGPDEAYGSGRKEFSQGHDRGQHLALNTDERWSAPQVIQPQNVGEGAAIQSAKTGGSPSQVPAPNSIALTPFIADLTGFQ